MSLCTSMMANRTALGLELTSSVETKNETFVWCGSRICQKRNSGGVVRNYFDQGFEEGSSDYFYARDHLGSAREVVGSDGATIASRRIYDPWGKATEGGSGALSDFGFTGHYFDRPTGETLTWYRGYDATLGRWLSEDPIGLGDGPNIYAYVRNGPLDRVDRTGKFLCWLYAYVMANALHNKFKGVDSKQHCYASCVMNRCGGGINLVGVMFTGVMWEAGTGGAGGDSGDDLKADWDGVKCSYNLSQTCEEQCDKKPYSN